MALFYSERTGCADCHGGFNFAGEWVDRERPDVEPRFADNGLGAGRLRVPTLRNIALTAPYMHDGRFATLEAVLAHYERSGTAAGGAPFARERGGVRLRAFTLDEQERRDFVAFLESLTDAEFVASAVASAAAAGDTAP
jgi:cytochrome c peroxidase